MKNLPVPRPFLKWAGGKTQLVPALLEHMPPRFNAYFEPFVGSGALFFCLRRQGRLSQAHLSDTNAELAGAYAALAADVEQVIAHLAGYPHSPEFFYALRAQDPWTLDPARRAARLIYLNKTGYNGLYRVNRRGQFNVPFGRYKNPPILDPENLRCVSQALQGVEISHAPFESVLEWARPGDWVYFDPPYAPLSATASFTAYQAHGFSAADQARLRDACLELTRRGVQLTLSNSDTPLIRELYTRPAFTLHPVLARRAINSNAARRGPVSELIITNYPAR